MCQFTWLRLYRKKYRDKVIDRTRKSKTNFISQDYFEYSLSRAVAMNIKVRADRHILDTKRYHQALYYHGHFKDIKLSIDMIIAVVNLDISFTY